MQKIKLIYPIRIVQIYTETFRREKRGWDKSPLASKKNNGFMPLLFAWLR